MVLIAGTQTNMMWNAVGTPTNSDRATLSRRDSIEKRRRRPLRGVVVVTTVDIG